MLRRFADARLARRLAEATALVRRLDGLLRQKTAEAATNYALAQRWKSIAQQAQAERDEARDALRAWVRADLHGPDQCADGRALTATEEKS